MVAWKEDLVIKNTMGGSESADDSMDESEAGDDESGADLPGDEFSGTSDEEDYDSGSGDGDEADADDDSEEESNKDETEESPIPSIAESKDNETDGEDAGEGEGNAGWADAMAKVLAIGKNTEKTVSILSKAKKDNVNKKVKEKIAEPGSGEEGEGGAVTEEKYIPLSVRKARKKEVDSIGRKMPNILDKHAEKALAKVATRGVVQLFNAVRDHQKDVSTKLKEAGGSFRRQEKVYQNIDKNSFVELLTGGKPSANPSEPPAKRQKSEEVKEEEDCTSQQSSWNILRDDFMLGAKMRDWDKESDGE